MFEETSFLYLRTEFGLANVAAMADKGELGLILKFESSSPMHLFWKKELR